MRHIRHIRHGRIPKTAIPHPPDIKAEVFYYFFEDGIRVLKRPEQA
jgi:hypothetical protein